MAVQITNTGTATIRKSGHPIIRYSNEGLLVCIEDSSATGGGLTGPGIDIYESTDNGVNWSILATLAPNEGTLYAPSMAFDGSIARLVMIEDGVSGVGYDSVLHYATVTPITGSTTGPTQVHTLAPATTEFYTDIAISTNRTHVVFSDQTTVRAVPINAVKYTNYNETSWSSPIGVTALITSLYGAIAVERQGTRRPIVACLSTTVPDVVASLGNAENATAFTGKNPLTGGSISHSANKYNAPSIAQDALGNEWVAFVGVNSVIGAGSDRPQVVRHLHNNTWATWDTDIELDTISYRNAFISTRTHGKLVGDQNVFAGETTNDTVKRWENYNIFNGTTYNQSTVQTSVGDTQYVKVRWANYHHLAPHVVDYVFEEGGNIYYDKVHLNRPF